MKKRNEPEKTVDENLETKGIPFYFLQPYGEDILFTYEEICEIDKARPEDHVLRFLKYLVYFDKHCGKSNVIMFQDQACFVYIYAKENDEWYEFDVVASWGHKKGEGYFWYKLDTGDIEWIDTLNCFSENLSKKLSLKL